MALRRGCSLGRDGVRVGRVRESVRGGDHVDSPGEAVLQRRRIIERPRLFALLDESPAQVRTLVASAGYGKTTLADQWVVEKDVVELPGTRLDVHPSTLRRYALGIARAASEIVTGCRREAPRAPARRPEPQSARRVLAELLGEDLADWSADDWLVLDEYQEVVGAARPRASSLSSSLRVRFGCSSRADSDLVDHARSILYGDVLELNQFALAMDSRGQRKCLRGEPASASGLVALANGWPAVIGWQVCRLLRSRRGAGAESLYRFFAEEVFDALGDDVRDGLATLSVAPLLDRELAAKLLGTERFDSVCAQHLT